MDSDQQNRADGGIITTYPSVVSEGSSLPHEISEDSS